MRSHRFDVRIWQARITYWFRLKIILHVGVTPDLQWSHETDRTAAFNREKIPLVELYSISMIRFPVGIWAFWSASSNAVISSLQISPKSNAPTPGFNRHSRIGANCKVLILYGDMNLIGSSKSVIHLNSRIEPASIINLRTHKSGFSPIH